MHCLQAVYYLISGPYETKHAPIFKNCEITIADIGEHMQEFCRGNNEKDGSEEIAN